MRHYFDVGLTNKQSELILTLAFKESIDSRSEFGDDARSVSAFSTASAAFDKWELNTLGDISPDAL